MTEKLRLLILESRAADVERIRSELRHGGIEASLAIAGSEDEFKRALDPTIDLVLSDFSPLSYDAVSAIRHIKSSGFDIPVIVVSGTLTEETAAACVREGAADYLLKDRLGRLPHAVERALAERRLRREKARVEEELRGIDRRFRAAIERSDEGIALLDEKMQRVYLSPSSARVLGWPVDELEKLSLMAMVHPDDLDRARKVLADLGARPGATVRTQLRNRAKDGSYRIIESESMNLLEDPDVRAIVVNLRDVTERTRAEERLRLVLDAGPDPLIVTDPEGRIVMVNALAESAFGYRREELKGSPIETLMPDRCRGPHVDHRNRYAAAPTARAMGSGEPLWGRRKDSTEFPVDVSLSPVVTSEGLLIASAVRDVTQRVKAEAELRRLNRALLTISDCNQVLVRAKSERELLDEICRVIVETGGHRSVWVAFKEHDPDRSLRAAAQRGFEPGFIESRRPTWDDSERGRSTVGTAIREGRPVVAHDYAEDTRFPVFRAAAEQAGAVAVLSLPLRVDGEVIGALSVSSGQEGAFDVAEIKIMEELADDLAFGIAALRAREAREAAEREVGMRERRFRALIENISDNVSIVAADGTVLYVTPTRRPVLGYGPEEMIGRSGFELVHPDDLDRAADRFSSMLDEPGACVETTLRARHKDGSWRWLDVTVTNLLDEPGIGGLVSIQRDVTERVISAQALQDSEAYLRDLIETAPVGIAIVAADGTVHEMNSACPRILGYASRGELMRKKAQEHFHSADDHKEFIRGIKTGRVESQEARFTRRDGTVFWGSLSAVMKRSTGGKRIILVLQDITHRKQAEAETLQNARRQEAMAHLGLEAMATMDMPGLSRQAAEIVSRTLGVEVCVALEQAALGDHLVVRAAVGMDESMVPGGRWFGGCPSAAAVRTRSPVVVEDLLENGEAADRLPKGLGLVSALSVPVLSYGRSVGALTAFSRRRLRYVQQEVSFAQGVANLVAMATERRRAEEALARHAAELARSNEDLERFAYVASHDLKEPLRMVASYVQLLERKYKGRLDADADEYIRFASEGANRMHKLINDLLAYARAGRAPTESKTVQSAACARRAVESLKVAIEEAGAEVGLGELPPVIADEKMLESVFQNLISNAVKFRGERRPVISVSAERDGDQWRFAVVDNGIGVEAQHHERIFVAFQRLHGREKYQGTGIGLAICRRVVERLGGRIWVESAPGRGSTFRFTLPAAG